LGKESNKSKFIQNFRQEIKRDKEYWKRISLLYDEALVDKTTAERTSLDYEIFEDTYLDSLLKEHLNKEPVILIEIGAGTGRYIARYGCMMSRNADHSEIPYNPKFDANLKLIIGVDFSLPMLKELYEKLDEKKLMNEYNRRIFLVNDYGEIFSLSFNRVAEYKKSQKIVCCVFNTLGNIDPEKRRILVLKRIHDLIYPKGIGIISVFNRDELNSIGIPYYQHEKVTKLIVPPKPKRIIFDIGCGYVRTDDLEETERFIGHWFSVKEIERLFSISRLSIVEKVIGNEIRDIDTVKFSRRGLIFKVSAI